MRHRSRLRRRYGHTRLTADILPYRGYGIMDPGEYKAHLAALRHVQDEERRVGAAWGGLPGDYADLHSAAYMASAAVKRAGLVRQGRDGGWRLTEHGREYLRQREGT